ncbi:MAG: HAD family phosphatase [Cyanobacteria bacterium M_surface_10_m2_119]|nr:HAD family phosphatase [Cyanobacteria bacterium M_surface_10_m2_119]
MGMPAACLFDLDGLLLDTEPLHARAWQEASAHFGLELTPQQALALRGRRRLDCAEQVRQWMAGAGVEAPSSAALLAVRQPIAERLLPEAPALPGAEELLSRCRELGIAMALVTSSSREAVDLKAAPHPWLALIGERVHGDDPELQAGKPEPDPYLLAARRLGVLPARCWAFEDSPAGARSASMAGCKVHVLLPLQPDLASAVVTQLPEGCLTIQHLMEVDVSGRTPQ